MSFDTSTKSRKWLWVLLGLILVGWYAYQKLHEEKKAGNKGPEISITVTNSAGIDYVYLKELNVDAVKLLDSLNIRQNSKGVFHPENKEAAFYMVQAGKQQPIILLAEPDEKLKLIMNAKGNDQVYEVTGSPGSALLKEYQSILHKALHKVDSLKMVFESVRNSDQYAGMRSGLDMSWHLIFQDQQTYARKFVEHHLQSLASLFVINQRLGPQRLLTIDQDYPLFARLDSALMLKYPENKQALDHHKRVSEAKRKMAEEQIARENKIQKQKQN